MDQTFRVAPFYLPLFILCTVVFIGIGTMSTLAALFNADGSFSNPKLAAILLGAFWSAFILLGLLLVRLSLRYRLTISSDWVHQRGTLFEKTIHRDQLVRAKWSHYPAGGSIKLVERDRSMTIEFGLLRSEDRDSVILTLRSWLPSEIQTGKLSRESERSESTEPRSRQRRALFMLVSVLGFSAAFFMIVGLLQKKPALAVTGLLNAAMAIVISRRLHQEAKGREGEALLAAREATAQAQDLASVSASQATDRGAHESGE